MSHTKTDKGRNHMSSAPSSPTSQKVKLVTLQYGKFEDVTFFPLEELPHHLEQILDILTSYEIVSIQYPTTEN